MMNASQECVFLKGKSEGMGVLCLHLPAGNFRDYWQQFESTPGCAGGFIWDWADQCLEAVWQEELQGASNVKGKQFSSSPTLYVSFCESGGPARCVKCQVQALFKADQAGLGRSVPGGCAAGGPASSLLCSRGAARHAMFSAGAPLNI
eukprot:scaffold6833_cov15-Tisochrysis_lutea.AAC.1